ncbi:MAG: hypothetical protein WCG93_00630 [Paludibacter sp.]
MKTKKLLSIALITVTMSSCMTTENFYQVYKTTADANIALKDNQLVYEDNNCKVIYNQWEDGGDIGFLLYNKTETNIYLNLEECFFISNGMAYNYFKNRVYTTSSNSGSAQSVGKSMTGVNYLQLIQTNSAVENTMSSRGKSVSSNEEKTVCIPALSSKQIKEYSIKEFLYRDCDLYIHPTKKQIKTLTFSAANSPLTYSNRIEYKVGQTGKPIKFENKFFVSDITNYPQSEMIESKLDKNCGEVVDPYNNTYIQYFKNSSPDKFYIKYAKEGTLKH